MAPTDFAGADVREFLPVPICGSSAQNIVEVNGMGDEKKATELPLGLKTALACDPDVLRYFANITTLAQERASSGTNCIGSKKETRASSEKLRDADSGREDTL